MMGIMMLTFMFFFAFVVNTGMLVNAKINLQNAADLAAYAGAAVQARQLTQISFLNYEMRRQYKKFLFRYYVLGNIAQCGFPGTQSKESPRNCKPQNARGISKTPMNWSPDGNKVYGVPVVCITFNSKDNYCQLSQLPDIARVEGGGAFDTITDVLNKYLDQIGEQQKKNCVAVGMGNALTLQSWLWNLDPDWRDVNRSLIDEKNLDPSLKEKLQGIYSVIHSLGRGLGLIPREVILRKRIDTLATYVNNEPQKNVNFDLVQEMKSRKIPEPPQFERTIQAFLSAYYTLGNHTFSSSNIQMDEIMSKHLLKLHENKVRFGAFAIDFPASKNSGNKGDCIPELIPDSVATPIPVGVYKDSSILTYYAIRLRAKATLLFSPFGDIQLKAYAAAQPFGSRIGPQIDENGWSRRYTLGKQLEERLDFGSVNFDRIPNLPIREDDSANEGNGWDTQEVMFDMHQAFRTPDGVMPQNIGLTELERAYHHSMAPSLNERRVYNIPLDNDDSFVRHFDSQGILAFWAPVFPLSQMNTMKENIEALIQNYWPNGKGIQPATRETMIKHISTYLTRLQKGDGERYDSQNPTTAEGFQIVRLADPVHNRGGEPTSIQGAFALKDLNQDLRTSWNDLRNSSLSGRIGYSVKLVSFPYLLSGKLKTTPDKKSTMTNSFEADPESEADLPLIKH